MFFGMARQAEGDVQIAKTYIQVPNAPHSGQSLHIGCLCDWTIWMD